MVLEGTRDLASRLLRGGCVERRPLFALCLVRLAQGDVEGRLLPCVELEVSRGGLAGGLEALRVLLQLYVERVLLLLVQNVELRDGSLV